ncbi:MAG: hypothetical protein HY459_03115 [Parcubacteria group bacterium]|nr:hypothetical protein [Parcubacteria group bacterium]
MNNHRRLLISQRAMKIVRITVTILLTILGLMSTEWFHLNEPFRQALAARLPAAMIQGERISFAEVAEHARITTAYLVRLVPLGGTTFDSATITSATLRIMVEDRVVAHEVTKRGLAFESSLTKTMETLRESYTDEGFAQAIMTLFESDEASFERFLIAPAVRRTLLNEALAREGTSLATWRDEALRKASFTLLTSMAGSKESDRVRAALAFNPFEKIEEATQEPLAPEDSFN